MNENFLKEAAAATPDPERALKNLSSFLKENPERVAELQKHIRSIPLLFSYSQFLANFNLFPAPGPEKTKKRKARL